MNIVVSDTSPLRVLDHLQLVGLLDSLFDESLVPAAVADELHNPKSIFKPFHFSQFPFLQVRSPADRVLVDQLNQRLGRGEAEAIALAVETSAKLLIDEERGRAEARRRALQFTGVAGVLTMAKTEGLISSVLPLLDRARDEINFYISPALRARIAQEVKE